MNKIGINFENVLSIKEELNISVLEVLNKLKTLGITSLDVKYERLIGSDSYLKDIIVSGMSIDSVFSFCPLGEQNNVRKAVEIIDFLSEHKIKEFMIIAEFIDGGYSKEQMVNLKQNLRRIVKYAENFGVSVGIENVGHINSPIKTAKETEDVLKAVKGLHLIFDGGNYLLADEDPVNALNLAPYVQRLHLKDRSLKVLDGLVENTLNKIPSSVVALGEGDSSIKRTFEEICKFYPSVPIVLEFPAIEKVIMNKIEKSAMYIHTELLVWQN